MKPQVIVDTNVILRLLLADEAKLHSRAKDIFNQAESGKIRLYIDEIVIAEVVWVLSSFYRQAQKDIAKQLQLLLSQRWIANPRKQLILRVLDLYQAASVSYIDCWLITVAEKKHLTLETFDAKLRRLLLRQQGQG